MVALDVLRVSGHKSLVQKLLVVLDVEVWKVKSLPVGLDASSLALWFGSWYLVFRSWAHHHVSSFPHITHHSTISPGVMSTLP
jgi:hypothetical protein